MPRFLKSSPRLPVKDLQHTVAFWTRTLGFELGALWPDDAPTFAILSRDAVNIQFHQAAAGDPTGHATLSFDVDDARALYAALLGQVPTEWGPEVYWYGRREFAIRDPDGYLVIFSEETDEAATCGEG
jgi:catechol 2,3-dioxygenase-like lactoylglutathione lyase family enzyme